MTCSKIFNLCFFLLAVCNQSNAQSEKAQRGILYKAGTGIRLGDIQIFNKRSLITVKSNMYGMFTIPASVGDTLEISCAGYNNAELAVNDFTDKIFFLKSAIALPGVVIKETSVQVNLDEVKRGYRKKSVFYTGTPHYYYLFLKPMTFIYENFKSEVKDARRFNRYAKKESAYYEISARFNAQNIKSVIPIKNDELEDFESDYWPALEQIRKWNDYDLVNYIIASYRDFKWKKTSNTYFRR
ncbi:hypothetical protein ACPPVU_03985 [Mucilaginibacter sp. McL0603]|uniref:hypothetical protein n=1 Tax=Mucilaginibacter sp. McL0603 TaxID=3415670 RepID=UPI003CE6CD84